MKVRNIHLTVFLFAATVALGGCLHRTRDPELVPTSTPGVVFVIVHPDTEKGIITDSQGRQAQASADYILLCDGRHPDGMHCNVVQEQSLEKASLNVPVRAPEVPEVPESVGVFAAGEASGLQVVVSSHQAGYVVNARQRTDEANEGRGEEKSTPEVGSSTGNTTGSSDRPESDQPVQGGGQQ